MIVEVCANSFESALNAEYGGANRIELCSELGVGGVTPSYGLVAMVLEKISIPVHVLIRPRSGNFTYSEMEFEVMLRDIEKYQEMGVAGIVSGVLNDQQEIDFHKTSKLVKATKDLKFTFHRAFDWVKNPLKSLETLENLGVHTILTSGGKNNVDEGLHNLKELNEHTGSCIIMPGGGVNLENIENLKNSGFHEVHFSASKFMENNSHDIPVTMLSDKFLKDHVRTVSDKHLVQKMINKIR